MSPQLRSRLWNLGVHSINELETERGILASSKDEAYGCIFGRDSLITALKLVHSYEKNSDPHFLTLVKKILVNLADLQGTTIVIDSGEEPGKIIHEYRPDKHEHLTKAAVNPWYVYPDNVMRNYDSIDSTPLFLMAVFAYAEVQNDSSSVRELLPAVRSALQWILNYGDSNNDGFIDYSFNPKRIFGGLKCQNWMDSTESIFFENKDLVAEYPIAPVEAQAYTYVALRQWSQFFELLDRPLSEILNERADVLKKRFNESFVIKGRRASLAFAIDGRGRLLTSVRSSMGHCLYASFRDKSGRIDGILDEHYVPDIVARILRPDLFIKSAGIRTLSSRSRSYDPNSYHNGSIWPHDTAMVARGLENYGYIKEAACVRGSILKAYMHFETPIELFVYNQKKFGNYMRPTGQGACRTQAWSAAALLAIL